jgi:hypothetical protein
MALRKIFGPKRDEVPGEGRRLHDKELYDLYSSPNIIWMMKLRTRWAGRVARMGDSRDVCRVFDGRSEEKSHL